MNRPARFLAALPFALAGCFSSTAVDNWQPPVVQPDPPPTTGSSLTVDDAAVTPDGNLLVLAYDYNSWDGGQVVQLLDGDLNVLESVSLSGQVYAMSIGYLSGNRAILSDGTSGQAVVDLDTGAVTFVGGYGDITNYAPGFLAADSGSFDDDTGDEVVNIPCENLDEDGDGDTDWDMDVFDAGDAGEGTLLARVDLANAGLGLTGATDVTLGGGLVYVIGYERAVAIDVQTGAEVIDFGTALLGNTSAWAYDATRNGLWVFGYDNTTSFMAL